MSPVAPVTIAAVQATPVFLDREATVARVCGLVGEAAAAGAGLVVFGEAFVPGYPDWVWRTRPWSQEATALFARLQDQAVVVGGPATDAVGAAASAAGVHVAVGVNERDLHGSTLYNTLLLFGPDGTVVHRHRKLMATGGERLVWGTGDGSTLQAADTPFGRVGGLICWENYMPLARAALYAQGVDILLAPTWDTSEVWVPTLRHIAKEGRVHVIGVAPLLRGSDLPGDVPGRDDLWGGKQDWMSRGLSTIVAPDGSVLAGPLAEEEGILLATVDATVGRVARQQFDPCGHYARPDVLRLQVDTRAHRSVTALATGPRPQAVPVGVASTGDPTLEEETDGHP
ncbi:MAG TPA: carbon-nitrogen hydrolase family protein [Egibacteraceae bacterium]|nr:carbon-nitrogen hydrolase family protein [Egibacteraceae bacterium]